MQWYVADAPPETLDLGLLEPVPLDLDWRWLRIRADGIDKYVRYFLAGDQRRPRAYAPFFVHPGALAYCLGETTIFRIAVQRYAMQGAPLCDDPAVLGGLFKPLRETIGKRSVVFFEGVVLGSPLAELLASPSGPVADSFHVIPYGPVYTLRLIELPAGANLEDYLATLSRKTREDVRRTRKNFGAKATARVQVICYTEPEQAEDLAAALAQVSRKTYQYHLLGLGLEDTSDHVAQLRATAGGGWLRAYVLWIGNDPMAFGLGYHDRHTYYGHHVGYDPAISRMQPGIFLHTEVMADLLANGIHRFDFLSGDSLYKQRMSNSSRQERHYYLIPRGWPGTGYAGMLVAINRLSEAVGRGLTRSGLKARVRRMIRAAAVRRSKSED